jgi:D-psicose/D-tagatose/L-ribulose 3-epimerase
LGGDPYSETSTVSVSIELEYSPDPARIVEWVEEAYRESARLMDLTGLSG